MNIKNIISVFEESENRLRARLDKANDMNVSLLTENMGLKKEIEELKAQLKHYELELQSDFDYQEWIEQSKNIN